MNTPPKRSSDGHHQRRQYAHLSQVDLEAFAADLDEIRADVECSLGARDRTYVCRTIAFQRGLDVAARLVIGPTKSSPGAGVGTTALATAKSIENMKLAHIIDHGQRDWMNNPRSIRAIGSGTRCVRLLSGATPTTTATTTSSPNVVGIDEDLGYGVLWVTRDEKWKVGHLTQPLRNTLMAVTFK